MVKGKIKQQTPVIEEKNPLTHPDSVQVLYRPVLQGMIPPIPDPDNIDFLKHKRWWLEQLKRCKYGWVAPNGIFINPIYYFYLNFCKIPIIDELTNKDGWASPYFRDGDKEYFDAVYYNMAKIRNGKRINAKDLIVAKGRRKGWTMAELFGITPYFFLFKKNQNISRAYPNDTIRKKEREQFIAAYSLINEFFKRDDKDNELSLVLNNDDVIAQGYFVKGANMEKQRIVVNNIFLFTANASGSGVRGDKLSLIVVVEAGLHKNLKTFHAAATETLRLGKVKFGMTLIGGTSDAINNESTDYKDMFYNPATYNATSLFTPSWKCFLGCIDYFTGKSLKAEAIYEIAKEREELRKSGDMTTLRMRIQENPFTPEESFIPSTHSEYDSDKIDNQIMHILREGLDREWITGKLEWERDTYNKKNGSVIFRPDPTGNWHILDIHGIPDHSVKDLYIAGIDDVYKDKAPNSDSKNAMVVYKKPSIHTKGLSDLPVAYYSGRYPNRMLDYEEFEKCIVYYRPKVMYEHNESAGFIGYARERMISDRFIYHNGQIGVRLSTEIKADMTFFGLKFFSDDRHVNITSLKIMESFKYWNAENTNNDIASAFHLVLFGLKKTELAGTAPVEEIDKQEKFIEFGVPEYRSRNLDYEQGGYFAFG